MNLDVINESPISDRAVSVIPIYLFLYHYWVFETIGGDASIQWAGLFEWIIDVVRYFIWCTAKTIIMIILSVNWFLRGFII